MLAIRLQRNGRTHLPVYRIIVQESQRHPLSGRVVAEVGSFDPKTKKTVVQMPDLVQGQRQRNHKQGHTRRGNAPERGRLRVVDVETGQAQSRKHGQHESETGQQIDIADWQNRFLERLIHKPIHDEPRSRTERNHVRERIQVGTNGRMGMEQAGGETI